MGSDDDNDDNDTRQASIREDMMRAVDGEGRSALAWAVASRHRPIAFELMQ